MATKRVLVYGGKGALGSACVSAFKAQKWVNSELFTNAYVTPFNTVEIVNLQDSLT